VWTNPLGFDNFVWNKIGQPKAGPAARSAKGLGPWMGPTIPADLTQQCSAPKRRFAYLAEREVWTNPFGLFGPSWASPFGPSAAPMFAPASCLRSRQIRRERIWTAERLAPQRAARRDWAHEWAQQSLADVTQRGSTSADILRTWRRNIANRNPVRTPRLEVPANLPRQSPQFHVA
jgi:hypothetical protein